MISTRRLGPLAAALLLGACGQAMPPQQPEAQAKLETPAKSESPPPAPAAPRAETPAPKVNAPPLAPSVPSSTRTAPAKPAAAAPQPVAPPRAAAAPPRQPAAAPAETPRPAAPPPLDLESLEARLKSTGAIGVLTKLSLKNQVDDLIARFVAFHAGQRPPTLAELRPAYELLLMKVLSLLQDKDAPLARDINASREAIWALLNDGQRLARYK